VFFDRSQTHDITGSVSLLHEPVADVEICVVSDER
jgi:hypothetical protein